MKEAREYKQGDNGQLTYKQVFDFDRFGNLYRKTASNPVGAQQNPLPYTPIEDADISKQTIRFATGTTYDEAGQVVNDAKFRAIGFGYDANGRTVKATKPGVPDAWTIYDGLGNRVATKIDDVWRFIVYDAFGKLVAEYGLPGAGTGGIKYIQQDWQGSVRTVTNKGAYVVSRTDHQPFGEEIGAGVGLRTAQQGFGGISALRQSYGLTERDAGSGLQHTWWRKLETFAGRWARPDPYKGSMNTGDPQSFNRYSYVANDPINMVDPTGLDGVGDATALAQQLLQSKACQKAVAGKFNKNLGAQLGEIHSGGRMTLRNDALMGRIVNGKFITKTKSFDGEAARTSRYTKPGSSTWIPYHISLNKNMAPWNTPFSASHGGWMSSSGPVGTMSNLESQAQLILLEFRHWLGDAPVGEHDRKFNSEIYTFCFLLNPFRPNQGEPIDSPGETPGGVISPQPFIPMPGGGSSIGYSWGFDSFRWLDLWLMLMTDDDEGTVTVEACVGPDCRIS